MKNRLLIPRLLLIIAILGLVVRLYQLQIANASDERYSYTSKAYNTRSLTLAPIRGEVFASDGKTLLAETEPIYSVVVRPADLPDDTEQQQAMFAQLDQMLAISSTLTLSPSLLLEQDSSLRSDLTQGLGVSVIDAAQRAHQPTDSTLSFMVKPDDIPTAFKLSQVYSSSLSLSSASALIVENANIPGYQTVTIRSDIPRNIALAIRENANSMPGVSIIQDYRRRYPLSGQVPSLSHMLGYIGRITDCELVRQNSARSWVDGMLGSIGHGIECGIIEKQIRPYELGMPRYTDTDRIGKTGIEASFEPELRGELGIERLTVDALGRPVYDAQIVRAAKPGQSIITTIDVGFQKQVEQILQNWINEAERRRQNMPDRFAYKRDYKPLQNGVAIVLEIKTGRILAMVSLPSYDNNVWIDPKRTEELSKLLAPQPNDPRVLINRAIAGQYPPGSTLKQFDAIIAMQNGIIAPDTKVRDPGLLLLGDQYVQGVTYVYPNSVPRDNGEITVSDALKVSSNVFFMSIAGGNKEHVLNLKPEEQTIAEGLDISRLATGLGWFGLGKPTGVDIASEGVGRVPTLAWKQRVQNEAWTTGDTYNVAIGQGNLEVTPLQLAVASAAIANKGTLMRPQIARAIIDENAKVIREIEPEILSTVPADPNYYTIVHEGMRRSVVEDVNVAARDDCSGLQIAGKTGTAEFGPNIKLPGAAGQPEKYTRQSHSWFVGFAPYTDPQIEVLVLSEGSGDMDNGSATIAVPAVTQIMQAYFGVTPPNPLPQGCQQNMPALPVRMQFGQLAPSTTPPGDAHER